MVPHENHANPKSNPPFPPPAGWRGAAAGRAARRLRGVLCFSANDAGQTRSYALDLATNTLNERPASYTPDGKSPQPYQICCGNDSWLYVQTGADARTIRYIGDDGQMKTGRRDVIRTGIMTPADYAAASLDDRPCTRLDAWG